MYALRDSVPSLMAPTEAQYSALDSFAELARARADLVSLSFLYPSASLISRISAADYVLLRQYRHFVASGQGGPLVVPHRQRAVGVTAAGVCRGRHLEIAAEVLVACRGTDERTLVRGFRAAPGIDQGVRAGSAGAAGAPNWARDLTSN